MSRYLSIARHRAPLRTLTDQECGALLSSVEILPDRCSPTRPAPPPAFMDIDIDVDMDLLEEEEEITVKVSAEELQRLVAQAFAA